MRFSRLLLVHLFCLLGLAVSSALAEGKTADDSESKITRSYDVRDIVDDPPDSAFLVSPQGPLLFQPRRAESPPDVPLFGDERKEWKAQEWRAAEAASHGRMDEENTLWAVPAYRAESLIELLSVRMQGADGSGEMMEGVSYSGGRLFVHAAPAMQEQAERVVLELRRRARRLIRLECLLVPSEVLDGLAPGWRRTAPAVDETVFTRALLDPRSRLLTAVAREGQKVTAGSKEIPALLSEQDVNQTGVVPVVLPIVSAPLAGDRLEIRPHSIPGRDAVLVDLAVGRFRVKIESAEVGDLWGDLDLPTTTETLISATTVMTPGKVQVVASLDGESGCVALARVDQRNIAKPESSAAEGAGQLWRAYDVGALLRTNDLRRWWWTDSSRGPDADTSNDPDALMQHLRESTGGDEVWEEFCIEYFAGALHVRATREMHTAVRQLIDDEIRRRSEVVAIDLEVLDMPREAFLRVLARSDGGFLLGAEWRGALEGVEGVQRWSYSLTGLAGEGHALRLARLRSLVTGVENVSGGTGYAIVEISDPTVDVCGEGREFRLQVDLADDLAEARLRLEGVDVAPIELRQVWARFAAISGVPTAEGEGTSGARGVGLHVIKAIELTLPRQQVQHWRIGRDVPLGQEVLLHSDAGEGQGARLLVARVRRIP